MNAKLSPAVSAIIILVAIGAIFGVMWVVSNQKGPHLPTGMGAAMQKAGSGQNRGPTKNGAAPGQGGE